MITHLLAPLVSPRFLSDERYRQGHVRIINALPERRIMGLHVPEMKKLAKELSCRNDVLTLLSGFEREHSADRFSLCYEETVVWGLVINALRCTSEERWLLLRSYVPVMDNWGVCDTFCCNTKWASRLSQEEVWHSLQSYFDSSREFEVRFAVVMSMCHLLHKDWLPRLFVRLENLDFDAIHSEYFTAKDALACENKVGIAPGKRPYYVRMAVAWLLATALAKFPEETRTFVHQSSLPEDVKRLYVRKARESFRTRDMDALR